MWLEYRSAYCKLMYSVTVYEYDSSSFFPSYYWSLFYYCSDSDSPLSLLLFPYLSTYLPIYLSTYLSMVRKPGIPKTIELTERTCVVVLYCVLERQRDMSQCLEMSITITIIGLC